MGFFRKLFGGAKLDGLALARSADKRDYAQIDLLACFSSPRPLHDSGAKARWTRVLPQSYDDTIALFEQHGWLTADGALYQLTAAAQPGVDAYRQRLADGKARAQEKVRQAIAVRDCSGALEIRRQYEFSHPLGKAEWTGPEPQLDRSSLTRRILFLNHWLLDGLSAQTAEWLKLCAAEQHLWEADWPLDAATIPPAVAAELATPGMDSSEAVYWKARQLALLVDNQETWQRCKGGDHVRRIVIAGADDEFTCSECRTFLGQEFLVARVPDLPHRSCSSSRGCRCRYEAVLEGAEDAAP